MTKKDQEAVKKEETVIENKEEISVPKKDFDAMMERIKKLEEGSPSEIIIDPDEKKDRFCRVVCYEDRPVNAIKDVVQKRIDEFKESVMTCTVEVLTKDGKIKEYEGVDYHDIRRKDSDTCKLIDVKQNIKIKKGGLVDEQFYNESTGKMQRTGNKVRLIEKIPSPSYNVEWRGESIWLDDVNISGN